MCVISNSAADIRIFLDDCISSHGCMFFFSPSFGDFEIESGQPRNVTHECISRNFLDESLWMKITTFLCAIVTRSH